MSQRGGDTLERVFPAPPDPFERLLRRRDQKVRRQRQITALVALTLGGLVVALALMTLLARQRDTRPASGPITQTDVAHLGLAWSADTRSSIYSQPVVANGRVYVFGTDRIAVYPTTCSGNSCAPIWQALLPGSTQDMWWGSSAVSGGRVYVGSGKGLMAFSESCKGTCDPIWVGVTKGFAGSGAPVVADGSVFIGAGAIHARGSGSVISVQPGFLYAFPESCGTTRNCRPEWKGALPGGFLGSTPVVSGNEILVGAADGTLIAFPTRCAASAGICAPLWATKVPGPMRGNTTYAATLAPPLLDGSVVYMQAGANLYAFPVTCARPEAECPPLWVGKSSSPIMGFSLAGGYLYTSDFGRGTDVFPAVCSDPCRAAWNLPNYTEVLAQDGVLWAVYGNRFAAFAADCGSAGRVCNPLWAASGFSDNVSAVEAEGTLFTTDTAFIYAFRVGAHGRLPNAPAALVSADTGHTASSWYLLFYAAMALVGLYWWRRVRGPGRTRYPALEPEEFQMELVARDPDAGQNAGPGGLEPGGSFP